MGVKSFGALKAACSRIRVAALKKKLEF